MLRRRRGLWLLFPMERAIEVVLDGLDLLQVFFFLLHTTFCFVGHVYFSPFLISSSGSYDFVCVGTETTASWI